MRIIAVISQKGGAGKTTLAINLAVATRLAGANARILDLDPQASATAWADHRKRPPDVEPCLPQRLARALDLAAEDGVDLTVIDTAPHAEGAALAAARAADLVAIPCRPALLDLHAVSASFDIARLAAASAVGVLNAVPARGLLAAEAREAIAAAGLPVLSETLGQRAAFVHSLTVGQAAGEFEPAGKAAHEAEQVRRALVARLTEIVAPTASRSL